MCDRAGVWVRVRVIAAHWDARLRPPTPVGRSPPSRHVAAGRREGPGGNLAATAAAATRVRTGLEASRGYRFERGVSLTPSVEVGLRHDGGMDVGAGLIVSDTSTGLAVDVRVRMLLVHQAEGFRERGLSIAVSYAPTPSTSLGVRATVTPSCGGQADSGTQALWSQETMAGVAAGGPAAGSRLETELWLSDATLVYQWDVRGGTIEPDDAQTVVWTAPETAVVAWIHVDVTHADGATAGQSAYVRVEVPEPAPEPEPVPVPALPFLDWAIEWVILQAQSLLRR